MYITDARFSKYFFFPELKYLDCSRTNITTIPKNNKLEILLCNRSNVNDISALKNLCHLEMVFSKITNVPYIKTLHTLMYDNSTKFMLANDYKLLALKKHKSNVNELTFKTENVNYNANNTSSDKHIVLK